MLSPFERGRFPLGCATMSGSFLAGKPREADKRFKKGATVSVAPLLLISMNAALVLPSRRTKPQEAEAEEQE
jgi:hypothetical protein